MGCANSTSDYSKYHGVSFTSDKNDMSAFNFEDKMRLGLDEKLLELEKSNIIQGKASKMMRTEFLSKQSFRGFFDVEPPENS